MAIVLVPLAGVAAFTIAIGNPITWVSQRVNQFNAGPSPSLNKQATRFGFNTGTGRGEIWRVALLEARQHPVLGDGAGGFHYAYLRERRTTISVHDAHSVELETVSELGVPGLALLLTAFTGAALGVRRARRVSSQAAALAAVAFAACSYWLVHTSIDWLWPYPAVTAPVIFLAGAACSPTLRTAGAAAGHAGRRLIVAGVVLLGSFCHPAIPV